MPFVLLIIGLLLVITGFQNTYKQLGTQLESDFTGTNNFLYWVIALGVVGAIGYAKDLQAFSRTFMALIIVGIFLSNKGFFTQFQSAISTVSNTSTSTQG